MPGYSTVFHDARVGHLNRLVLSVAERHPDTVPAADFNRFVCPHGTFARSAHGVDDLRGDVDPLVPRQGQTLVGEWLRRRVGQVGPLA